MEINLWAVSIAAGGPDFSHSIGTIGVFRSVFDSGCSQNEFGSYTKGMVQRLLIITVLGLAVCPSARADVFELASGGRIEGKLLNTDQSPRETYIVLTTAGRAADLNRCTGNSADR